MRIGLQAALGVLDADAPQHGQATLADLPGVQVGMQLQRFAHLLADLQRRIE
ncbi:hypothetical protein D3C84_1034110 [compost metagenome]